MAGPDDDDAGPHDDEASDAVAPEPGDAVEIPITGELDLHPFSPRDVASVVEEYVNVCQERNVLALRLVHGKGTGAQRAVVRRILRSLPAVVSFGDAPAERGGFGATVVTLRECAASQPERAPSSRF
jgi:dsDNA-specific endonuclease/ATPase MutS2